MPRIVICADCGQEKPHHAKGRCKTCYNRHWCAEHSEEVIAYHRRYREEHREEIAARKGRWYQKHREAKLAYNRRYREEHPRWQVSYNRRYYEEHREKIAANRRRYYQEHREEILAYSRRWRQENPDYMRRWRAEHREDRAAYMRHWQKENPQKLAAKVARRRARKNIAPDTLTADDMEWLLEIGRTTYPGEELHLDHIVPVSRGGGTTLANMQAIPASVNLSKGDALPQDVYEQLSILE